MDVREKLEELLCNTMKYGCGAHCTYPHCFRVRNTADHLISHGVTVQELDGCGFCKKFDFAGARAEINKYGAHISLAICNTKFPDEERFKFCPMCGRRLPQPPKGG